MRTIIAAVVLAALPVLGDPLAAGAVQKEKAVAEQVATGTFEVKLTPLAGAGGPVGAISIEKSFTGALSGTSRGQMLAVRTAVEGSAGYVAMEQVTATLGGRSGSFALQHSGTMDKGAPLLSVTVVPDSGEGALAGLTGTMAIDITGDEHRYTFRYRLPG